MGGAGGCYAAASHGPGAGEGQGNAQRTAAARDGQGLQDELQQDVAATGANAPANSDFPAPFRHTKQHERHDHDSSQEHGENRYACERLGQR